MIDSGNTFSSVISPKLLAQLGYSIGDLIPYPVKSVGSAKRGAALQVLGQVPKPLIIQFGGTPKTLTLQPVVLKDLNMDMNISGPTLQQWGISQHHRDSCLELNGTRIKMIPPSRQQDEEVAVVLKYDTVLQPGEEARVELIAPAYDKLNLPLKDGCIEGSQVFEETTDLHTYRCALITGTSDRTLIAGLWNTTEEPITVKQGTRYGTFFPLDANDAVYTINSVNKPRRRPRGKKRQERSGRHKDAQPTIPEATQELPDYMYGPTNGINKGQRILHIINAFKIGENDLTKDPATQTALIALLLKHFELFAWSGEYGKTDLIQHEILLKEGATPFKARYRLLNPNLEKELDEQLDKWIATGVIEPANSPWSAPLVPVKKKSTPAEPVKFRWCVDYRGLNTRTIPDASHIGDVNANLTRLEGSRVFTTLDASGAFHQIPVAPESRECTAFSTHRGSFQFTSLPFGVINGPATYARLVQMVLNGVATNQVLPYLDDILIHSPNVEQHFIAVDKVLTAHADAGLKLNPKKCHFFQEEVVYLGHKVTATGTLPIPEYVELVQNWPTPTNKTELRAFIGKAAYYRRFIKDFAQITEPLYDQLKDTVNKGKKGNVDSSTPEFQRAFQETKNRLSSAPVLAHPRFNDPSAEWILDTDWSKMGNTCGMVLSQVQDGVERPIAFHGVKLKASQRNYSATKGELAAVILGLQKFKYFLTGTPFTLRTDHKALEAIQRLESPEPVVLRWLEILAHYNFKTVYRPGPKHGNADSLSRRPNLPLVEEDINDDNPPASLNAINEVIRPLEDFAIATPQQLQTAQMQDSLLHDALHNSTIKNNKWKSYKLIQKNGFIYIEGDTQDRILTIALPTSLLLRAAKAAHHLVAHRGTAATLAALRTAGDAPLSRQAAESAVASCLNCQLKTKPTAQKALYRPKTAGGPFQVWSLDFVGPFPPSGRQGVKYVLTLIDVYTKWPEAFPCKAATADLVLEKLTQDIFPRFGLPTTLHSDRGTHFVANTVTEAAERLGIKVTTTPAYHPASNPVERFNQDLGKGISALAGKNQKDWAAMVPAVLRGARSTPHRGTQVSPFELVFGRKPRLAQALLPGVPIEAPPERSLETIEAAAKRNLQEYHLKKKKYYRGTIKDYQPGTLVSLFTPVLPAGASSKFKHNYWTYPWKVTRKISELVYEIQATQGTQGLPSPQVVTIDRLRRYKDGSDPQENGPPPTDLARSANRPTNQDSSEEEDHDMEAPRKRPPSPPAPTPKRARAGPSTPPPASPPIPPLPPRTPATPSTPAVPPPEHLDPPPRRSPRLEAQRKRLANLPRQQSPFCPTRTSTEGIDPVDPLPSRTEQVRRQLQQDRDAAKMKTKLQAEARDARMRHRSGEPPVEAPTEPAEPGPEVSTNPPGTEQIGPFTVYHDPRCHQS